MLLAMVLLAACGKEDEPREEIKLTGGTGTEQVLYADETGSKEGIKFVAAAPWTAVVEEVPALRADSGTAAWLKLSAYSGGAGEFTLTMTLLPNTSGKSRKAQIRITAGKTVLTILVEQKAETEDEAGILKPIQKIIYKEVLNSDAAMGYEPASEAVRTFSYDEQGRVARIHRSHTGDSGKAETTITFDYTIVGEIAIREKEVFDEEIYEDAYIAKLNEQGNVAVLQTGDKNTGVMDDLVKISYADDGRLVKWEEEHSSKTFSYTGGLLSKYEYADEIEPDDSYALDLDITKAYAKRYPNLRSIDLLGLLLFNDTEYDFLWQIGRTGKTSDYLPEVLPYVWNEFDYPSEVAKPYTTPNISVEKSYNSIEWFDDDNLVMDYAFDENNRLTTARTQRKFRVMKTTYTIVVGDRLIDPNNPERGYDYEITSRKTEKVKEDSDSMTFEIVY